MPLGDVATWFTGLATFGAFVVAFVQINNERKIRKNQERKCQAEHISAYIAKEEKYKAWITILNSSAEPIYEVIVSIVAFQGANRGPKHIAFLLNGKLRLRYARFERMEEAISSSHQARFAIQPFLSVVPPGKAHVTADADYHGMSFHPSIEIAFKDVRGKSWVRSRRGDLTETSQSPVNYYKLSRPLGWQSPEQEQTLH